jgi:hypothetical protein
MMVARGGAQDHGEDVGERFEAGNRNHLGNPVERAMEALEHAAYQGIHGKSAVHLAEALRGDPLS